ncbi:Coenzyme F420 hydrogenase/dehydrogenase, beta subunit C-terminal domain [Clostridium perfringens]|uniref:Coenzyme F420 hydrogenase/dehydrogenase, beta subunit C-terminal domain n=1 Tax=Clostridium perfringens TaxID=1502 RepID=UPI0022483A19|nr:Coenzyme F420 hydrogenase/dehydrogenase, beta subunit C-terminal domain [Clostridium perfringens]MCX0351745.1 Coenzyme F420 hydrogenase/dehydrogenase, beta subunit C-terminal domain [Clostridium perfringens]
MISLERKIPNLFDEKKDCCGCGACLNICPKNAISMEEDQYGFKYPKIDETLCIGCHLCKKVCAFQNTEEDNSPIETFAAVSKDKIQLHQSASGGIFAAIAQQHINEEGVVFGAAFDKKWNVCHIGIERFDELKMLQGSKYVQSDTKETFREAKELLELGKKVLYSGTPCQIAGLKKFLNKEYSNLLTIDIICHGVPNNKMFKEYLNQIEQKENGKVVKFVFRDKRIGWGKNGSVEIKKQDKLINKKIWESTSSYLYYFTQSWIYRENCYLCKYASLHRPADITLGDYWGIEKEHPEYIAKSEWDESKGISVVIANTNKGLELLKSLPEYLELRESSFEKASSNNGQLKKPSTPGKREEILSEYLSNGWNGLEKRFNKKIGIKKYKSQLISYIPKSLKKYLKRVLKG